jgi:predicted MFS family arabinose efflux permease
VIVDHFGYSAAFLTSAAVAAIAFATLFVAMPETARAGDDSAAAEPALATVTD